MGTMHLSENNLWLKELYRKIPFIFIQMIFHSICANFFKYIKTIPNYYVSHCHSSFSFYKHIWAYKDTGTYYRSYLLCDLSS